MCLAACVDDFMPINILLYDTKTYPYRNNRPGFITPRVIDSWPTVFHEERNRLTACSEWTLTRRIASEVRCTEDTRKVQLDIIGGNWVSNVEFPTSRKGGNFGLFRRKYGTVYRSYLVNSPQLGRRWWSQTSLLGKEKCMKFAEPKIFARIAREIVSWD